MENGRILIFILSNKMWCFDESCNRKDRDVDVYGELFEEDKHYVAFESPEELKEKVLYYKENEDERKKIVNNAYEHALKNHTWDNRAEQFLETINARFGR